MEVIDNMVTLLILPRFRTAPEVRSLPSTGVTRFRGYYEPFRLPGRPGLSLAGVRLQVTHPHRQDLPCCVDLLCRHAVALTPVGPQVGSFCSPETCDGGLPHPIAGSAPTLDFSRPTRRSHYITA